MFAICCNGIVECRESSTAGLEIRNSGARTVCGGCTLVPLGGGNGVYS